MPNAAPLIGNLTPPFELEATEFPELGRRTVSLADYRGRWLILIFYPRDFSLVCPTELKGLSKRASEFREHGCDLLAVSTDSVETHARWLTTPRERGGLEGLAFPLASDPHGEAARAYNVYLDYQKVALRGLFIIDPNGVLQYQVVHNLSVGRRTDDVLRILSALQTGGLCAEDWQGPADTLDPTERLLPDSVVSHYRVEGLIGRGSFAKVYRARDLTLDRPVALKVFKPGGPITAAVVLEEARSTAALIHPNVCTVFAVDDSLGVPAIAMEYVDGRPLSQVITERPLDPDRAAAIGRQIAEGMAAAHAHGVVHGDLKPENVMVADGDAVKILDFGLSRRFQAALDPDATVELGLDIGGISGTPSYLAPERTWGGPATTEADVFALGLTLHEMVTGRKAFSGPNVLAVLSAIRRVDPASVASGVPEPFAAILRRSLQPDPSCRTIDMKEIAEALDSYPAASETG
jgi:alkyl hydroperoxide reductase subunit AhpC